MTEILPTDIRVRLSLPNRLPISRFTGWLEKLLLIILCWQFAGLFWVLFAPSASDPKLLMPTLPSDQRRAGPDALLRWFGAAAADGAPAAYSLVAVIAGQHGAAVLKGADGKAVAVRVGEEIAPGSRLLAVLPDEISIERAGVRQVIKLPQTQGAALIAGVAATPARALPAIRMTRGKLAGILQGRNLGDWDKGLSTPADGGIRVDRAATQALARMLELKNGDILKSVNGRRLDQVADSSLLFHYFAQQSSVDIVLLRDGATLTQHYDIQP